MEIRRILPRSAAIKKRRKIKPQMDTLRTLNIKRLTPNLESNSEIIALRFLATFAPLR